MQPSEATKLLTYMAEWDNRVVTANKVKVWADGLPDWLTLNVALAAARRFYTEPTKDDKEPSYLSSRLLLKYAMEEMKAQRQLDERMALNAKMKKIDSLPAGTGRRREIDTGGFGALVAKALKGIDDAK